MPVAANKSSELIKDINGVLVNASGYVAQDNLWFRRKLSEADKLKVSNEAEAFNVLAQLYGLAGDRAVAERYIDTAIWLRSNDPALLLNKAVILSNLGCFSAAVDAFKAAIPPRLGQFTSKWYVGMPLGCFHALAQFVDDAVPMKLEHIDSVDTVLIAKVVRLMDEMSLTDDQLVRALDVAGEMLREERMFFVGPGPYVAAWDEDQLEKHVYFGFKLPVSIAKAIELDEELGRRLFEKYGELPPELMIHFESGLPANERIVERPSIAG